MSLFKKILFVVILLIPFAVKAESGIENYYINAVLKENGDLVVEEYFYMNGEYNGMEREILFKNEDLYDFRSELDYYGGSKLHNADGLELIEIRALEQDDNFDFSNINGDKFTEVTSASKGDYGVYTTDYFDSGNTYMIYLPSKKKKAFYLKYTLKNLAVLHDDVGEIFWNAVGTELRESIGNLKVTITLPNNQNELLVWAHGPLNGNIKKVSNNTLMATVKNVRSYQAIDIRAVFDKEVISNSLKKTNVLALDKIINYEEDLANQANYEREQEEYIREQQLYEDLEYCNKYVSRYCYQRLKSDLKLITNQEVIKDIESKLILLEEKVILEEENTAKFYTKNALKYLDYYWYSKAEEAINILENEDLKKSLNNDLNKALEGILTKEEEFNKKNITFVIVLTVVGIGVFVYIYLKADKEEKVLFEHKYMRDFPNDYSPSTVEYLFKKKITDKAISAEILNLIYKKIIIIKNTDERKNVVLEKNSNYNLELSNKEQALLNLLFGSNKKTDLKTIKKLARNSSSTFVSKWKRLQKELLNEALKEKIYAGDNKESNSKKNTNNKAVFSLVVFLGFVFCTITGGFFLTLLFVIIVIIYSRKTSITSVKNRQSLEYKIKKWGIIIGIVGIIISLIGLIVYLTHNHFLRMVQFGYVWLILMFIILIIYTILAKKKTLDGMNSFVRWKAFKKFLNDFGKFEKKELPEVILWEKYLIYATVLGCAKKLAKDMEIKVNDFDSNSNYLETKMFIDNFATISFIAHTSTRSMESGYRSYTSSSSSGSNWSSGSGGGGGFSSGGGFGGGGGGGGRF